MKNLSKDGRYYWVITEFETKFDSITNELISIEVPRGFTKDHIFNGNDTCFISLGKNSKKENILSILKEEF